MIKDKDIDVMEKNGESFSARAEQFVAELTELSNKFSLWFTTETSELRDRILIDYYKAGTKTEFYYKIDDVAESSSENSASVIFGFKCPICGQLRKQEKMFVGCAYAYPMCFKCHGVIERYLIVKGEDQEAIDAILK